MLVVFDLFQTLVSPEDWWPSDYVREDAAAEALGIDPAAFTSFWDGPGRIRYRQAGIAGLMFEAALVNGVTVSAGQLRQAMDAYGRHHDQALSTPRPDVLDGLKALQSTGKRLALLSNADEREVAGWSTSPLARLIPLACFSYLIGAEKPEVVAYKAVLEKAGVAAGPAVFVGDGGSQEFEGARQIGFGKVVCITGFGTPNGLRTHADIARASEVADDVVAAVSDLPALLSR